MKISRRPYGFFPASRFGRRSQSPRRQQPGASGWCSAHAGPCHREKFPAYSNAEIRLLFDGIAARIATIGQLYRILATVPTEGTIPLQAYLKEVCANLITAFSSAQQPLTLIVCEILTSSLKYAHPAGAPAHMSVTCESRSDGALEISVGDDGVGLPEGFDPMKDGGIGFQVIRALAAEIGANLDVRSDDLGVTFRIVVPQALVANARTA
jgi:two-component sensor histidine kinase